MNPGDNQCMAEDPRTLDASGSSHGAEPEEDLIPAPQIDIQEARAPRWSGLRALRARVAHFEQSAAGRYWAHLSTSDGFGVCLHPVAVFGRMSNEREDERALLDRRSGRD
jgi:hypothetical protein